VGRPCRDLTGQVFGRLTVTERGEDKWHSARWLCKCACGTERIVQGSHLNNGTTKSCGCFHKEQSSLRKLGKPSPCRKRPYECIYNILCSSAKKRNIPVELTLEEFTTFTKQDKCHYCYAELTWNAHPNLVKGDATGHNIDRKNNDIGYTKNNCIECCGWCNMSKHSHIDYDTFYAMTEKFRTGELKHAIT